jgi:light-regulated signal transduction histidine kinase (bacteriophytochrome)
MPDGHNAHGLDLAACEREPIHIPGAIQQHGVLLALSDALEVCAASANADPLLGPPMGRSISQIIECGGIQIERGAGAAVAQHVGTVELLGVPHDAFVHRSGAALILELEKTAGEAPNSTDLLAQLLATSSSIAEAGGLMDASKVAAEAARAITGYDRVMIYRFLGDGSGQVIAEDRSERVESLLNHRYPASDIPAQARALYVNNPVRVIPDVAYAPVALDAENRLLDLSGAVLRSVSPYHIQYLKNMGVGASASISILRQGELWGLIACQHLSPKPIGHLHREMCRHVALLLATSISCLEEEASQREVLRLTRRREELLPRVSAAEDLADGLTQNAEELRRVIASDGVAILAGDRIVRSGACPTEADIQALCLTLTHSSAPSIFSSDELSSHHSPASGWGAYGSGLLSVMLSRSPPLALLWFRAEEIETVNWAGNPHKPLEPGASTGDLTPRRSFEVWAEQVRGRSRPWRPNELEAAQQLADRLTEIAEHKALSQLGRQLSESVHEKDAALAAKDLMVREVHHRVQNNLQVVTAMLKLQKGEIEDEGARQQLELASDRIRSISTLHRLLWRSENMQVVNLESFFSELSEELVATRGEKWRGQVQLQVTPIQLPGHMVMLLGLAVTELLTNAFKHAYGGAPGPITLVAIERGDAKISVTVRDRGVGGGPEVRPESFGSRLVQRLIQQMGGQLNVTGDHGTCVTLLIPRS